MPSKQYMSLKKEAITEAGKPVGEYLFSYIKLIVLNTNSKTSVVNTWKGHTNGFMILEKKTS